MGTKGEEEKFLIGLHAYGDFSRTPKTKRLKI